MQFEYADIFREPTQLPPFREGFDHKIPLKEGTQGINLKPYRYPLIQKDVIEQLTREVLEQGVLVEKRMGDGECVLIIGN